MIITTVVTQSQIKDFLLMKGSCEIYNPDVRFDVICDEAAFSKLSLLKNDFFNCVEDKSLKDGDHVGGGSQKLFEYLINVKFNHALQLFDNGASQVLWCDCDHIFLSNIQAQNLPILSAYLTPHYSNNFADERTVGFYNCGFVIINDVKFLIEWKRLYDKRYELGLYFEQKALELTAKAFTCGLLPINYNVGWWKFLSPKFESNSAYLDLANGTLYGRDIVNFHLHYFGHSNHNFEVSKFRKAINIILSSRNSLKDKKLLNLIDKLSNEDL